MFFDMAYPSGKSINHYAFHLLYAYACYLVGQGKHHDGLFNILVSCYEFAKHNIFKQSQIIKQLLSHLISTCMVSNKYSKIIEYGNALCSLGIPSKQKASILSEVGNAYQKLGQYEAALGKLNKSLKMSDKKDKAHVYYYFGMLYRKKDEWQKALKYFEKQLEISKKIRDIYEEGAACSGLGNVYCTIGEHAKARKYLEKSLEISETDARDKTAIGKRCHDLANVYAVTGKREMALDYYEKALKIAEEVGDKEGEDRACSSLGRFYRLENEFQKAYYYHTRSSEISKELGDNRGVAAQCINLGNVYTNMGDKKKSREFLAKALQMCKECGDIEGELRSYFSSGVAYFRNSEFTAACNDFCENIVIGDKLRKDFEKSDRFNMSMAKLNFNAHMFLMLGLLNLKHIKKALLVLDVGRSKALFDLLRLSSSGVNESLLESQSRGWIEQIPSMLDDPNKDSHSDISENVCQSLQDGSVILFGFDRSYANLLIWVLTNQGTFFERWAPPVTASIMPARDFFSKVYKHITPTRSPNHGFEDERDSLRKRNTEMLYEIHGEIQNVNLEVGQTAKEFPTKRKENDFPEAKDVDEFENPGRNNTDATLRGPSEQAGMARRWLVAAYHALIDPIKHHLTGSKLVIVPADFLFLLPFSALLDRDGKYLCDRYSIQIAPSLHTLNFSLSVQLKPLGPALCVGNPPVSGACFGGKVVNLPSLPNAEVEAAACATYFEAVPLLNKQATKKKVLERMKKASVIHIAAHGNANYGEIFLAPNPKAPSPPEEEHYLLTPEDIILNSLSARLVVLSCCHSGRGEISSEGVAGTARAFLGAGARAVLVALWEIPDMGTCKFMKLFYENVCKGHSVCVALQQAMRTFKEEDDRMESWAPFEIFGQDVTITSEDLETIRRLSRECKQ